MSDLQSVSSYNNLEFYTKHAAEYEKITFSIDPTPFLSPLVLKLTPRASILDIGCGAGRDLLWLRNKGFLVCGLEQSPNLLNLAKKKIDCPFIKADFTKFDFSQLSFDAIIAIGAFVHIEHLQFSTLLFSIIQSLKTGGFVLLSMKEGNGSKIYNDGRIFYFWQRDRLEPIFQNCELEVVSFFRQVSQLHNNDIWMTYLLKN